MFTHFRTTQDPIYATVLAELRHGDKRTHWMWFIFPQLRALGRSETARRFGIADLGEAGRYLADPVVGDRLRECVAIVTAVSGRTAHEIFGSPDDLKFRSSLTLFEAAAKASGGDPRPFAVALERFYGGERDPLTLELLMP